MKNATYQNDNRLRWFFAAFSVSSCAGKKTGTDITKAVVPVPVKDAFATKYPGAIDIKWEKETENAKVVYEVGFKLENIEKMPVLQGQVLSLK